MLQNNNSSPNLKVKCEAIRPTFLKELQPNNFSLSKIWAIMIRNQIANVMAQLNSIFLALIVTRSTKLLQRKARQKRFITMADQKLNLEILVVETPKLQLVNDFLINLRIIMALLKILTDK